MKKINLLLVLSFYCFVAYAQVVSKADFPVVEKVMSGNMQFNTIVSRFKQIKHLPMLGEDVISKGDFYYHKPEQLTMRYTDPAGDLMMINGDRFVMVAAGKKRETSGKTNQKMQGMKAILSACLQGNILQIGAEKVTLEETADQYIFTAIIDRKANKSNFEKVVASYDKKNLSLSVLTTIERDGSYTSYELIEKKFNTSIEGSIFTATKW